METMRGHLGKKIAVIGSLAILVLLLIFIIWKGGGANSSYVNELEPMEPSLIIELPKLQKTNHEFTCTGLAYDASANHFWIGNYGLDRPGEGTVKTSLVEVATDFSVVKEVVVPSLGPSAEDKGVQGVAYDSKTDSLWVVVGNVIANLDKNGQPIHSFELSKENLVPNGIAYDNKSDSLWVLCTKRSLLHITPKGDIIESLTCDIADQDQLYIGEGDSLFFTAGADYRGNDNWLYEYNVKDGRYVNRTRLLGSYAVEGVAAVGDKLYIMNDGYYHEALDERNAVCLYTWNER